MRIIQWISSLQTYKEIWSRTEFCLNLLISKINFRLVLNYPCWNGNNQNLKVNLINVISYIYIYCPCHIWPLKLPQQTCQLSRLYQQRLTTYQTVFSILNQSHQAVSIMLIRFCLQQLPFLRGQSLFWTKQLWATQQGSTGYDLRVFNRVIWIPVRI